MSNVLARCLLTLTTLVLCDAGTEVGLRIVAGRPVVDGVFLNGQGPFRFLIDTGSETNELEEAIATKLALAASFQLEIATPAGVIHAVGGMVAKVSLRTVGASSYSGKYAVLDPGTPADGGVPLTVKEGLAYVDAFVNDHGPFRLLVDTGSGVSSLTANAARRAKLCLNSRSIISTMVGEKSVPGAKTSIRIGGADVLNAEVLEIEMLPLNSAGVDGILGQSFLSQLPFMIDYRRGKLFLAAEASRQAERLRQTLTAPALDLRPVLVAALEPGHRPFRLVLDSAATSLIVRCDQRCPQSGNARGGELGTLAGNRFVQRGTLRYMDISGIGVKNAEFVVIKAAPRDREDGLLPASWFTAVYVDAKSNIVRLGKYVGSRNFGQGHNQLGQGHNQ